MNEQSQGTRMQAMGFVTNRACNVAQTPKVKREPKKRVKMSFEDAVEIILKEDGPLLQRLAD